MSAAWLPVLGCGLMMAVCMLMMARMHRSSNSSSTSNDMETPPAGDRAGGV